MAFLFIANNRPSKFIKYLIKAKGGFLIITLYNMLILDIAITVGPLIGYVSQLRLIK